MYLKRSSPQIIMKFSSAINGSNADATEPLTASNSTEYAKNAALSKAIHFILIGIKKNSSMRWSGKSTANAKNIERLRKFGARYASVPKAYHIIKP